MCNIYFWQNVRFWYDSYNKQSYKSYKKPSASQKTAFKTAIFRTDISDHLSIPVLFLWHEMSIKKETTFMYKTNISVESIGKFKHSLFEVDQDKIELNRNPNKAYQLCSQNSLQLCQKKEKNKDLLSP